MPSASALPPDAAAWLAQHGAVDVRVDADGVIEFSARPLSQALADAVRDLLPRRQTPRRGAVAAVAVLTLE